MADITLRFFGAFRSHGESMTLTVADDATAAAVKAALVKALPTEATLIADSALASDDRVLAEDAPCGGYTQLAILPPVCGG